MDSLCLAETFLTYTYACTAKEKRIYLAMGKWRVKIAGAAYGKQLFAKVKLLDFIFGRICAPLIE